MVGRIHDGVAMGEQEDLDIDSDYMPSGHARSIVSMNENEEEIDTSASGRDPPESYSRSYSKSTSCYSSDSVEYYTTGDDSSNDGAKRGDDGPTSVSEMPKEKPTRDSIFENTDTQPAKKGDKRGSFLGRLFRGKMKGKNKKKVENTKSLISDEDIYSRSGRSNVLVDMPMDDTMKDDSGGFDADISIGDQEDNGGKAAQSKDIASNPAGNSTKRISFEQTLSNVVEDVGEDADIDDEYKPSQGTLQDSANQLTSHPKSKAKVYEESDKNVVSKSQTHYIVKEFKLPRKKKKKTKSKSKSSHSSRSSSKKKFSFKNLSKSSHSSRNSPKIKHPSKKSLKSKKKTKSKAHASALAARNHSVSSRLNFAGEITSQTVEEIHTDTLKSEVDRLKTLVQLMMTRMELYERQSECLVEASLEHDQEWKLATLKNIEKTSKKVSGHSETEETLDGMKTLLAERSIQDEWIRKLEEIQRSYQERLLSTQYQLRKLRCEHMKVNTAIVDMKKKMDSTSETARSTITPSTVMDEDTSSNMPLKRWAGTSSSGLDDPMVAAIRLASPGVNSEGDDKSKVSLEPAGYKVSQNLLEEMIVSWRCDDTDMSPLSEKINSKKQGKKKKDKKKKHGSASVASSKKV